jgi:hypothetical protein
MRPMELTARRLAEILTNYGDLPVVIMVYENNEERTVAATDVQVNLTVIDDKRTVEIVGYLP